jgi:hypothetical protein
LAKKWQDVEFVDYKERQRRRRLKRRQLAATELKEQVTNRWNVTLIVFIVVVFFVSLGGVTYYIMRDRMEAEEGRSRMYVEIAKANGEVFNRGDRLENWMPVSPAQRFDYPRFFRTENGNAVLRTYDGADIKMTASSEIFVESIEVFRENQSTKSNLRILEGELIFDSRNSQGALLEVAVESFVDAGGSVVTLYASPGLFKTMVNRDGIEIKLSRGVINVEYKSGMVKLETDTAVKIDFKDGMGEVFRFNPLSETW